MSHGKKPTSPGRARKPYTRPRLTHYGHVKDVVKGNGGGGNDGGGNHSKVCWIAEAIYGVGDPRTMLLRASLWQRYADRQRGWALVALYRRIGPGIAALIRRGFVPRSVIRPLFDRLHDRALVDAVGRTRRESHR